MNRPGGVTAIAILWFVLGGLCALLGVLVIAGGGMIATILSQQGQGSAGGAGMLAGLGAVLGVVVLFFAALYIVVAFGVWKLKEWARILGIVLSAIGALLQVLALLGSLSHFQAGTFVWNALWLAIDTMIVIYLLKPEVKAAFQGGQVRAVSA